MDIMRIDGALLSKMFRQAAATLNTNKAIVDALNVFPVPDGDTGTNMSLTMNSAMNEIGTVAQDASVEVVAKAMSKGSLMGARGNSGVILSQIFRGFSKSCQDKKTLSSIDFSHAIKNASDMAYKAVMKPVEGTILTVIRKTGELAMDFTETEVPIQELLENLIKRAEETLERTPDYLPVLKQAGVVDSGGKGLVYILLGFLDAVLGKEVEIQVEKSEAVIKQAGAMIDADTITFSYCTEFILQSTRDDVSVLRSEIQKIGDSMVFVHDDEIIKIHIHTDNPGIALEKALKFGALMSVKIENMREQHSSLHHGAHEGFRQTTEINKQVPVDKKTYGIIAVAMGEGFAHIFRDLGVTVVVQGGQTMNPSTEDFLKAAEECHADQIFILPNNSNIILAANQAKEVSNLQITVIPTKSIPQGITTLIEFDAEATPKENEEAMLKVISNVKTLQVTFSVRDTQYGEIDIKKDNILGVGDGNIIAVGDDIENVTLEALDKLVDDNDSILTIYYGAELSKDHAESLADKLSTHFPALEIEVHSGGQPLYYYVISVE